MRAKETTLFSWYIYVTEVCKYRFSKRCVLDGTPCTTGFRPVGTMIQENQATYIEM
jgi:hypothetical protein